MADDIEVKLQGVRLSFFRVFDPQDRKDDAGNVTGKNFNCALLIPKTDAATIQLVKDAMAKARINTWGQSPPAFGADQLCLRDGEPVDAATNEAKALYDGYAGCLYVSANRPVKLDEWNQIKAGTKKRPVKVIGPRKGADGRFAELNEGDPYAPYSGCYVNAIIRIYGYVGDNGKKSRINASLEAIQFAKDGEAFASRGVDVDAAFDEVDVPQDDMGGAPKPAASAPQDDFNIG